MGCCFSCEEDDDLRRQFSSPPSRRAVPEVYVRHVPPRSPVAPVIRRPIVPTASSPLVPKPIAFKQERYVPPQRPIVHEIRRPTATTSSTRSTLVPKPVEFKQERYVPPQRPIVPVIRRPTATTSSTRSTLVPKPVEFKPPAGALYGEYKCHCGYFWVSRLSWRDRYQQCKRCKSQVRPKNQRELKPTDFISPDKFEESLKHPQELCEMCKQVGGYCGKYKQ